MRKVLTGAMVDCRRDSLWQKLLLETEGSQGQGLTHVEFLELISLVHHETLDKVKLSCYLHQLSLL